MPRSGWTPAALAAALLALPAAAHAAGGMPQLDFKNPLTISQVVWGAIIFVVLYILLSRFALPKVGSVLEERAHKIAADLDGAKAAKAKADGGIAEAQAAVAKARSDAQAAISQALEEAKAASAAQAEALNARLDAQAERHMRIRECGALRLPPVERNDDVPRRRNVLAIGHMLPRILDEASVLEKRGQISAPVFFS